MKKCRVLLIDINRISLNTSKDMLEYPLGLLYLSASLKKAFGARVDVEIKSYDNRLHANGDLRKWISEFQPDILGLRSLTMGKFILHKIAHLAKLEFNIPLIVAGGPHATDSPHDVLSNKAFDIAVPGEGEQVIVDIVTAYMNNDRFGKIAGIALRTAGGYRLTSPRPIVSDLDRLPLPDHNAVDFKNINRGHVDFSFRYNAPHANLFTSRGCPYKCIYCHHVFGKKFRVHSAQRMFMEVKDLHDNFGIDSFQIIDDIFNLKKERALDFFNLIVKSNMKVNFSFPNGVRGDLINGEMVDAMWEGGVRYMAYAIETGSPRIQELIKKYLNLEKINQAISLSTAKGIVTRGFFMFGFPTETEDEVKMTIDFANSSDLVLAMFFTVLYFPGTTLYNLAKTITDIDSFDLGLEEDYVSVREGPYNYSKEKLEELKHMAILSFFFSDKRLKYFYDIMPNFYTKRDMDATMLVNIISSDLKQVDIGNSAYAKRLHRHFLMANRFSEKTGFYV